MSVTRADVILAYRLLLGRSPENDEIIETHMAASSLDFLGKNIANSLEYSERYEYEITKYPIMIYFHIHKATGSSFRTWLDNIFDQRIFWHNEESFGKRGQDVHQVFNRLGPRMLETYAAIGGHFGYDAEFIQEIRRKRLICATMRNPIDRIISHYEFIRNRSEHGQYNDIKSKTLFEAISTNDRFYQYSKNYQIRTIFGENRTNKDWTLIGKSESFPVLIDTVRKIFGLEKKHIPFSNRGSRNYREDIEKQSDFGNAVDLIKLMNEEEIEFFNSFDAILELKSP